MPNATYDDIAAWYEHDFLPTQQRSADGRDDPLGIRRALRELLGEGSGACLEIGCGTGIYATPIAALGWDPFGVDLSSGMLRYARDRLPIARADAEALPVPTDSLGAIAGVMTHTDMPDYPRVIDEVVRALRPGGVFVHVGVHPCFCGGFADRSDPGAVVIRPGYLDGHWTTDSWTNRGVRDKVGAAHWPLHELLNMFNERGLHVDRVTEGGEPTPVVLGIRARTSDHR